MPAFAYHAPLDWCRACPCPEFEPSATHAGCDLCTHHPVYHLPPLTLSPNEVAAALARDGVALERCKQEGCACPVWVAKAGEEDAGARAECEACGHRRGWHKAKNLGAETSSPASPDPASLASTAPPTSALARSARASQSSASTTSASPSRLFDRPASMASTAPTSPGLASPSSPLPPLPLAHTLMQRKQSNTGRAILLPTVDTPPLTPGGSDYCTAPPADATRALAQPSQPLSGSAAGMQELTANLSEWTDRMQVEEQAAFDVGEWPNLARTRIDSVASSSMTRASSAPSIAWSNGATPNAHFADRFKGFERDAPLTLSLGTASLSEEQNWPRDEASDRSEPLPYLQRRQGTATTATSSNSSVVASPRAAAARPLPLVTEPSSLVQVTPATTATSSSGSMTDVWHKVDAPASAKVDLYVSPPPSARTPIRPGQEIQFRLRLHSSKPPAGLSVAFVGNSTVVTSEHRDSHNFVTTERSILPSRSPGIDLDLARGEYRGSLVVPERTNCLCAIDEHKPVPGSFSVRLAVVSYRFEVRITKHGVLKKDKDVVVPVLYLLENPEPRPAPALATSTSTRHHPHPTIADSDELTLVHPIASAAPPKFLTHFTGPVELAFKLNPPPPPEPEADARGRAGHPELARSVSWRMAIPFPASAPRLAALEPLAEATKPFLGQKIVFRSSPSELKPGKQGWGVNAGTAPLANPGEGWVGEAAEVLDNLTGEKRWVWEGGVQARRKDLQAIDLCNLSVTYHLLARLTPQQGFSAAVTLLSPPIDFAAAPAAAGQVQPGGAPARPARAINRPMHGHQQEAEGWNVPPPAFEEPGADEVVGARWQGTGLRDELGDWRVAQHALGVRA